MANNDSTDNVYVNDATTDSAKIWDGDEYSETTWLNQLVDDIEADSQLRDLVHSNIVMLRNGMVRGLRIGRLWNPIYPHFFSI